MLQIYGASLQCRSYESKMKSSDLPIITSNGSQTEGKSTAVCINGVLRTKVGRKALRHGFISLMHRFKPNQ